MSLAASIVATNKQDLPEAATPDTISTAWAERTAVVPCVAIDLASVKNVLLIIIHRPEIVEKIRSL